MKITEPKITAFESFRGLDQRRAQAIFVRKHDLPENLEAVQNTIGNLSISEINRWLFLVEGHKKYGCQENLYLDELVEKLGVRTEDPVYNPFTPKIAQAVSIDHYSAALSVFVIDYLDLLDMSKVRELDSKFLENLINNTLESISKTFGISPQLLKRDFKKLEWNNPEKLSKQILALSEIRKNLINESNSMAKIKLGNILNLSPEPRVFIMSGIEHEPVFIE